MFWINLFGDDVAFEHPPSLPILRAMHLHCVGLMCYSLTTKQAKTVAA